MEKNESHPTRDGWIEIRDHLSDVFKDDCPIPHGMGGLKSCDFMPAQRVRNLVPSHTGWVD